MNKIIFIFLLSVYCMYSKAYSKELSFGTIDYCPLVCKKNIKHPGIMIEIAREIFKETDYKINISFMSLKQAMDKKSEVLIDGFILGSKVHFKNNHFPSRPTLSQPIYFFTNKDSKWTYKNTNSLKNVSISAIENFNYMNEGITSYFKTSKDMTWLKEDNAHKRAFQLLERKRVQTFIGGGFSTQYLAKNLKALDQIKISSPSVGQYDNYISLNNRLAKTDRLKVLKIIDTKMPQLKKSGFINKVINRYGIE